jgi:hypothetical protein
MLVVVLLVGLVALAHGATHRVSWGFDLSQASLTVYQADTVTWVLDQGQSNHSLSSPALSSALGSSFGGSFLAGESFRFVVSVPPGTYAYFGLSLAYPSFAILTVLPSMTASVPVEGQSSLFCT